MKLYYRAVSHEGKSVSGLIEAKDSKEVAVYLRRHNLVPIKINVASRSMLINKLFVRKPKLKDRIFFTRQVASMLTSGLTLMQSLEIVKNQVGNAAMEEAVHQIIAGVQDGKIFSEMLQKNPDLFPPVYVALVKTSEASGLLDKVLLNLADNLEKQDKLQRTIKGALMYPLIVITVMLLVMGVMMIFVLPQLTNLYSSIDVQLPASTKIVLGISTAFSHFWYIGILGIFAGVFFLRKEYKKESGRRLFDGFILKTPVFGKLIMQTMMAEFTRTLGLLIGAGSLVVDSLVRSSDVVSNVLYRDAIVLISKRVEKGITIGDAMDASPLFPPMVVEMVKIGEKTGQLESSLLRSSEYFEREVDQTVKNLTTLIEPIVIVVLALGVGFLIFSIITPIYGLISSIK